MDDKGFLFVEGRQKDLIIVSGRNIYPQVSQRKEMKERPKFRFSGPFSSVEVCSRV